MSMAIRSGDQNEFNFQMPSEKTRYQTLSDHPVSAALHFERILSIIIEQVIGWDEKNQNHT
jgi:hypothetical protein